VQQPRCVAVAVGLAVTSSATAASAQVPAGPSQLVNTYTTGHQVGGRIAGRPGGDFVVTWHAYHDGDGFGSFGQRFDASGARVGFEFGVNAYTTGLQYSPVPVFDRTGQLFVTWYGDYDVWGRLFDHSGAPVGTDVRLNSFTPGWHHGPAPAATPNGFVVTWSGPFINGYPDVVARRFDRAGVPQGSEFLANTYTTRLQHISAIASDGGGNFVVVWRDDEQRDGSGTALFAQRFDAAGFRLGGEFQVNTYTTGATWPHAVAMSPPGDFVVAWRSYIDGDSGGVSARRFDAAGAPIGSEFQVNTAVTGDQMTTPGAVSADARGNFVIVWTTPGGEDVQAQRFDRTGVRRGAEFTVNAYTTGSQGAASVFSDDVGNFVVTWTGAEADGDGWGVALRRFGGLRPTGLRVDSTANRVVEPGESFDVRPTWRNTNGAAQSFTGRIHSPGGPPGGVPSPVTTTGSYGTVPDGAGAECNPCYALSIADLSPRPLTHWDVTIVETIVPDAHGQEKNWVLHVGRTFTDVPPASPFYRFVETLIHNEVTGGCAAGAYCPGSGTTRAQMAVFLLVAREGTGYAPAACGATPMFPDVPTSSPFCKWIEELARRSVVAGCGGGNYCPASFVTRDQMAVFTLRTVDPTLVPAPCAPPNLYGDVPETNPFCPWIEELTSRGIVAGCGGGNYCPANTVTREQMAVFMTATFGLTLYGP